MIETYPEKIKELQEKLEKTQKKFDKFKKALSKLKVGDTVYEHGMWDDYHPQIVKKIDLENGKLLTHEKSINVTKWTSSFYLLDKKKEQFIYFG